MPKVKYRVECPCEKAKQFDIYIDVDAKAKEQPSEEHEVVVHCPFSGTAFKVTIDAKPSDTESVAKGGFMP